MKSFFTQEDLSSYWWSAEFAMLQILINSSKKLTTKEDKHLHIALSTFQLYI